MASQWTCEWQHWHTNSNQKWNFKTSFRNVLVCNTVQPAVIWWLETASQMARCFYNQTRNFLTVYQSGYYFGRVWRLHKKFSRSLTIQHGWRVVSLALIPHLPISKSQSSCKILIKDAQLTSTSKKSLNSQKLWWSEIQNWKSTISFTD